MGVPSFERDPEASIDQVGQAFETLANGGYTKADATEWLIEQVKAGALTEGQAIRTAMALGLDKE